MNQSNDHESIYRDLREDEIRNLPLELKAAFLLQPWNHYAKFDNVDDWIEWVWILPSTYNVSKEDFVKQAKEGLAFVIENLKIMFPNP